MLRTKPLNTGRPKNRPELKKLNGSEAFKLLRRQPLKKRAGWKMAQENSVKKSLRREKGALHKRKQSY